MIESPGLFLTILAFALVIGPLVFVHEMGHYLAGRWFGVKAEAFSIGFGREVFGLTDKRGTRWKFGWLPLGGYVKFAGDMNPASQPDPDWYLLPAAERAQTFQAKPLWQRAIIVAAGPFVNFVIAFLILMGFALAYGDGRTPAVARDIVAGSAAANAGMLAGDRITALGGRDVATFDDVAKYIQLRANQTVHVDFDRNGRAMSVDAAVGSQTLRDRFGNDYKLGLLGIAPVKPVWVPVGVAEAPVVAVKRMGSILTMMVDSMGQIISGKRPVSELGGPLRIAKVSGEQLALGLPDLIGLIALVSINLGFINILPVPMLDGGHLFFYAVEAIRRRPVRPEVQEWAFRGGLIAILALMLMVTFNDLGSFGLWNNLGKSLAGLIG